MKTLNAISKIIAVGILMKTLNIISKIIIGACILVILGSTGSCELGYITPGVYFSRALACILVSIICGEIASRTERSVSNGKKIKTAKRSK